MVKRPKTPPFHGGYPGSNPGAGTIFSALATVVEMEVGPGGPVCNQFVFLAMSRIPPMTVMIAPAMTTQSPAPMEREAENPKMDSENA